jgi:hypothetical protein
VEDHVVVIASLRKSSEVLASLDTRMSVSDTLGHDLEVYQP